MSKPCRSTYSLLITLALAAGCPEPSDPLDSGSPDTDDTDAAVEEFVDEGGSSSGVLAGPTAVEYAVMLALIIVVCLEDVTNIPAMQDFLDSESMPQGAEPPVGACYSFESGDPLELVIHFDGCDDEGMSGDVTVRKVPLGPVVITFGPTFTMKGHGIVGSVAFDRIALERLWSVFDSNEDGEPGTPLVITDLETDESSEVTLDTYAKLDIDGQLAFDWGVGEVASENRTDTYFAGGTSEDAVNTETPPADVLTWELPLEDCLCPTDGIIASELAFVIDTITIDLDDYEAHPDDDDEYEALEVDVPDFEVEGLLAVDMQGCGEYSADFQGDANVSANVTVDDLQAAKDEACGPGGNLEGNTAACTKLQTAIGLLPDDWNTDVDVPDADLDAAATEYVKEHFDEGICNNE